jgi:hypothetical protein
MAAIGGSSYITLQDYASRLDPTNKIAKVVEILHKKNAILDDIIWKEGNLTTGHTSTIRTGIPSPAWRILNYGVAQVKSSTAQVTDTCGMMEAYSKIDKKLAQLNGDQKEFLLDENKPIIEGFGQTLATTLFYGNTATNPEQFLGLAPRYNSLSTDEDLSGYNVIDAGGTGSDNTSIWMVVWGPETVHGIYPKGSTAGMQFEYLGEDTNTDSNGLEHQILRSHYVWDCGLTVRNWRGIARVANIDMSDLNTTGDASDTSANILKYMQQATDRVEEFIDSGNAVFYMHPEVRSMLTLKLQEKGFAQLSVADLKQRQNVLTFNGMPVRSCRALTKTESAIS